LNVHWRAGVFALLVKIANAVMLLDSISLTLMFSTFAMNTTADYYVYVYIDPRNYEEFYYGKGKGNRKDAHLTDDSDSDKAKRIGEIKKAGLKPIIRVIVKDLTEKEAFLIEKTLIWKLGKTLTNKSTGHFAEKFRPHNTVYRELQGFDFRNEIYYVNVGEGPHRNWDDCKRYGFLSAGQGKRFSDPLKSLQPGDIVVAYLKTHGFVGVGIVQQKAVHVDEFKFKGKSIRDLSMVEPFIIDNCDNEKAEFLLKVNWKKSFDRTEAKWKPNSGLFTSQLIKASLQGQPRTLEYLEKEFEITFSNLLVP
jgi:hypothetical protein